MFTIKMWKNGSNKNILFKQTADYETVYRYMVWFIRLHPVKDNYHMNVLLDGKLVTTTDF